MASMVTAEQLEAESLALRDQRARIARNDPDWGLYFEGDPRPVVRWWHRVFGLTPKRPEG